MKKKPLHRIPSLLAATVLGLFLLTGCAGKSTEAVQAQEDADTIQVYLWTNSLYEKYAPYVQAHLPDVNIEFIVGNNDLDFYKFLQENGGLPDIITCCRFSLHDAAPLKDSLMDLATTNEAGAVYNTYLNSFRNEDGSVNWLPVCADTHGFVVNRGLFKEYGIPLPTDYASFAAACKAFDEAGIRGFTADYLYDYTCMETLQGLSAAELTTTEGRKWRTAYSDPADTARVGLDNTVWPGAFARMEQFIRDTGLTAADLELNYDDVTGMFGKGELAMYFSSSAGVQMFREQGIDATFLPFFSQNGEKWLMTTPYFQVALNRDLEQDAARRVKAMQVLHVMLSEGAQEQILADGQDLLSYSQNVSYHLTHTMEDVRSVVEENHMYIRIASNDFFAISQDVVSKMIAGKYDTRYCAEQRNRLFQRVPQKRRQCVLLGYGKHAARAVRHRRAGGTRQQLYRQRAAGRLYPDNSARHDHAQRTYVVPAHHDGRRAEGHRAHLCGRLRGRLYAVQPRFPAGGQRHCRAGAGERRQLYADRHHPRRPAAAG